MHAVGLCSNCGSLNPRPLLLTDNNGNINQRANNSSSFGITTPGYQNDYGQPQKQACGSHGSWTPQMALEFQ